LTHILRLILSNSSGSSYSAVLDDDLVEGSELETKVILHRNITYQNSSASFLQTSTVKKFLQMESQLAADIISLIEMRETILFELRIESEQVNRSFLTSTLSLSDQTRSNQLENLLKVINKIRFYNVQITEKISSWIGLNLREKLRKSIREKKSNYLKPNSNENARSSHDSRQYCVAIAVKGSRLYRSSKPVSSFSR
jgi:hypothetical protein